MRPFEILILMFAALSLAPFIFPRRERLRRLRWLSLSALAALFAHIWLEGARWQMWPAYLLAIASLLLLLASLAGRWRARGPALRLVLGTVALLWLVAAAALPTLLPVPQPLAPTGPYGVGTRSYYLVDESRQETYSEEVEHRELLLQVWYPAEIGEESEPAPFIEGVNVAGPAIARRLGLPPFILGHLDLVRTAAYLDAPAASGGPFPLLIFSHGLRGLRQQNTSLMQELASYGYVVAAIDHTYGNVLTVFPGGRVAFFNAETVTPQGTPPMQWGSDLVGVWVDDIAFVIAQLEMWSGTADHPLQGQIDAQRLGLLGHSTGGGAAIQACATVETCDAALALDGWIQPVSPAVRDAPYEPALMMISAPDWLGPDNRRLGEHLYAQKQDREQDPAYLLTVAGTVHFDFTDIPLMSPVTPLLGLSGDVDGPRMVRILNRYSVAFFDRTLKGQSSPLLEGAGDEFPEVRFGE